MLPVVLLAVVSTASGLSAAPAALQASRYEALLAEMHPDYGRFIRRVLPAASGARAAPIYMGLVRPGGEDPRRRRDAPRSGHDRRFDLVVFSGPEGSGWSRLLVDHEYFHARRLAHSDGLPHPSMGSSRVERDLHEALAWGYNLDRADGGAYGDLPLSRRREALERYRAHRESFRDFVLKRDPPAWAYYGRFLPRR